MFKCQECGKKFRTVAAAERAVNNGCPKCNGGDIDIDPDATRVYSAKAKPKAKAKPSHRVPVSFGETRDLVCNIFRAAMGGKVSRWQDWLFYLRDHDYEGPELCVIYHLWEEIAADSDNIRWAEVLRPEQVAWDIMGDACVASIHDTILEYFDLRGEDSKKVGAYLEKVQWLPPQIPLAP